MLIFTHLYALSLHLNLGDISLLKPLVPALSKYQNEVKTAKEN